MRSILLMMTLFSTAAQADGFPAGKYEWIMQVNGQTQRTSCDITRTGDAFLLKSGEKEPLQGTVQKDKVDFSINSDANYMKGSGTIGKDGWVRGDIGWGQRGVILAKGTFVFAPINTPEDRKQVEAFFKSSKAVLKLPPKSKRPPVKAYDKQVMKDSLGSFQVDVPKLGGEMESSNFQVSPVTKMFRFEFEGGDLAVLVATKMRDDRPKNDSAVVNGVARYKKMQEQLGADLMSVDVLNEKPNRMLEYSIINPAKSPFIPIQIGTERSDVLKNIAVSQTIVKSGRYIEFCIISKNYDAEKEDDFRKRITSICSKWRESLSEK